MPKRRERDRPKAAPGSLYNPNKRVLLSYASDDDDEEQPIDPARPPALDARREASSLADDAGHGQGDDINDHGVHDEQVVDETSGDDAQHDGTAVSQNDSALWTRGGPRKNARTGQWAVLGSLSYEQEDGEVEVDEEEYDSGAEEAMAYLRAVRSERQNIPEVLTGPPTGSGEPNYDIGAGDYVDFLDDEAYIGPAVIEPSIPVSVESTVDPQVAFTSKLVQRFHSQRKEMHTLPSAGAVAALDEHHPISFPKRNNNAYADWHRCLRNYAPQPAQVRAMEQNTVFNILDLLKKHFLVRNKDISATTSAWTWALLARLNEVGTMNNDQVWVLREFGKKAILVQLSFDEPEAAAELERQSATDNGSDGQPVTTNDGSASGGAAGDDETDEGMPNASVADEQQLTQTINDSATRQNTLAILDSIIVIVGEVFGQRDLMEFRRPWPKAHHTEK